MEKQCLITGTFIDEITYDIPSSNWGVEDWKRELDYMQEVGIDTLIFIRGGFEDKTIYPSKAFNTEKRFDLAGLILNEATKRNMSVFVGLYISNVDWNNGNAEIEIQKNKLFINEFYNRYGDIPSFKGWYLPHETCCREYSIVEVMNGLSYLCKEKTPEKPIIISPVIKSRIITPENPFTPERYFEEWDGIFSECGKNIDIVACQDGTAPNDMMADYFRQIKRLCDKHNMKHWVNTETFERDVRNQFYPIPFETLRERIDTHQEYAEKIITFEFSHFLSPQSIYPSARNLNKRYKEYYGL